MSFRALVVDMSNKKNIREGDDNELHFYKMFFWLIYKNLVADSNYSYDIFLHRKNNSVPGRLSDLKNALNNKLISDPEFYHGSPYIRRVEPRTGKEVQLQLADLFAGAIAYVLNGSYEKAKRNHSKNAKVELVEYIEQRMGVKLNENHTRKMSRSFNIWHFRR